MKRTCHLDLIALRDPKLVIHEDDLLLRARRVHHTTLVCAPCAALLYTGKARLYLTKNYYRFKLFRAQAYHTLTLLAELLELGHLLL